MIVLTEVSRQASPARIVMEHEATKYHVWIEPRGGRFVVDGHDAGTTEAEAKSFATTRADSQLKRHAWVDSNDQVIPRGR